MAGQPPPREGVIPINGAEVYCREIGRGRPIIVLHGGPDFDYNYLLPDLDRLSDSCRLIYYDQRGRGRSADNVSPEDVTLDSDIDDLDGLRKHFGLESVAVLGHSWGGLLAMEYAIRQPDRVSHLILLNTAPASRDDLLFVQQERRKSAAGDLEQMKALASTPEYEEGDPETVAAYYRIHFSTALRQPDHLEPLLKRLLSGATKEGILKARQIEDRLMDETWKLSDYDLLPKLRGLSVPTLVIHGRHDFIPVECSAHVAQAIPGSRFVVLQECGHFSYLECPDDVHKEIDDFFQCA